MNFKYLISINILIFSLLSFPVFALSPPEITSAKAVGTNVSLEWSQVDTADGYRLYYAPSPFQGEQTIRSIDMHKETSISVDLWDKAAFYVATTAYKNQIESSFSNIKLLEVDLDKPVSLTPETFYGFAIYNDPTSKQIYTIDTGVGKRVHIFGKLDEDLLPIEISAMLLTDSSTPEQDVGLFLNSQGFVSKVITGDNFEATYSYSDDGTQVTQTLSNGSVSSFSIDPTQSSQQILNLLGEKTGTDLSGFFEVSPSLSTREVRYKALLRELRSSEASPLIWRTANAALAVGGLVISVTTLTALGAAATPAALAVALANHGVGLLATGIAMTNLFDTEGKLKNDRGYQNLQTGVTFAGVIVLQGGLINQGIKDSQAGIAILSKAKDWADVFVLEGQITVAILEALGEKVSAENAAKAAKLCSEKIANSAFKEDAVCVIVASPDTSNKSIAGTWVFGEDGATWTFTAIGDNQYHAQESGYGNAFGTAIVNGDSLYIEFECPKGICKGYYYGTISADGNTIEASRSDGVKFTFRRSDLVEVPAPEEVGIPTQSVCPKSLEVDNGRFNANIITRNFESFESSVNFSYIKICKYKDTSAQIIIEYSPDRDGACGQSNGPVMKNGFLKSTDRTVEVYGFSDESERITAYWDILKDVLQKAVVQFTGRKCAP